MESLILYAKPELIILAEKKKLRSYQEVELNTTTGAFVYKLLALLGVKDGNLEQHNALANHIKVAYKHQTFEQMDKAFELFISGQLKTKPFQQLNAVVFGQVMNEYFEYEKEQTKVYKLKLNEFKNQAKPMEQTEKDQLMEAAINAALKEYTQTGEIELAPSKYDWLDSKGKLQGTLPKAEWDEIKLNKYESVKTRLIEVYSKAKASSTEERSEFKNIIQDLQGKKSGKIIAQSKYELLKDYFNSLIS